MRNRQKKELVREVRDPRVEFARLAGVDCKTRPTGNFRQPVLPPEGVDRDFCFSEDLK